MAPDGKKRKAMAFCPWLGGKRICFGKTFAEANMKILAIYMAENFDMSFVDKERYPDTHSLPLSQVGLSEQLPIMIRLTKHE